MRISAHNSGATRQCCLVTWQRISGLCSLPNTSSSPHIYYTTRLPHISRAQAFVVSVIYQYGIYYYSSVRIVRPGYQLTNHFGFTHYGGFKPSSELSYSNRVAQGSNQTRKSEYLVCGTYIGVSANSSTFPSGLHLFSGYEPGAPVHEMSLILREGTLRERGYIWCIDYMLILPPQPQRRVRDR